MPTNETRSELISDVTTGEETIEVGRIAPATRGTDTVEVPVEVRQTTATMTRERLRRSNAVPKDKVNENKRALTTQQQYLGRIQITERGLRETQTTTTGEDRGNVETTETRWMITYMSGSRSRDGTPDATSTATNKVKQENLGETPLAQETGNYTTELLFLDETRNETSTEANNRTKQENLWVRTQGTQKLRS